MRAQLDFVENRVAQNANLQKRQNCNFAKACLLARRDHAFSAGDSRDLGAIEDYIGA